MIPRRYGYVPTPYNPQPALSQEEFHQLRIRRGFLAEKITREKLSLIELDNEYLFLNAQSIPFTQSTPDAETQVALIEIKDMSALAGPNNKENKILVQAVRHSLVAKQKGLFSVLIVGYKTEVTHSISAIYDFIIRAPLLGAPIADFHPDHYSDDTDLGAVGGEGNSHLYDSHYQEEYIIEPRGCCPIVVNQQDCIHFLHGRRAMPYPLRTEDIIPGPSHNTLVELLNTLLHLVPDVRDDQHSSTSASEQIHILESPNTRLHNNNPFSQPTPPLPHDYLTPVAFEFTENILQQSLEDMLIEEVEDEPDEDEDEIEEVLRTTQPDIDKAKIKTEEDDEIDSTTIQPVPCTHTRKERQVARKAARQAQQEKMRAERQKHLDKQSKSKENKDKKKKNPGESRSRAITNPSYDDYARMLASNLESILSQQQESIEIRKNNTTHESLSYDSFSLETREPILDTRRRKPLSSQDDTQSESDSDTSQLENKKEEETDHATLDSPELQDPSQPMMIITEEEQARITDWLYQTFSLRLNPSQSRAFFILLSEEGISTRDSLAHLHKRAIFCDRLRLIMSRIYQVSGYSFLPEIAIAWLSSSFPQLAPTVFLGEKIFSPVTLASLVLSSGVNFLARTLINTIIEFMEYKSQDSLEPRYHNQHRYRRKNEPSFGPMHNTLTNTMNTVFNNMETYETQSHERLRDFRGRFHQDPELDTATLRNIAHSFTSSGLSSERVLSSVLYRADPSNNSGLTLTREGMDYRSNIPQNHTHSRAFHFTNGFLLGIRYRVATGANSVSEILKKLQEKHIINWKMHSQESTSESKNHYLRLLTMASYLNQHSQTEEHQWSDFLKSLTSAHPLAGEPIAQKLGNSTLRSLRNSDSYSETEYGLFQSLLFNGGNIETGLGHRNPEIHSHGQAFQEIPDETPLIAHEEIPFEQIGINSLVILLNTLLSDMALDNPITEQGLGRPIWINPNNQEQTRQAIRSLQSRPHSYRREQYYRLSVPNPGRIIENSVDKEVSYAFSRMSYWYGLASLPFVHLLDFYNALKNLRQTTAHEARRRAMMRNQAEEETEESIVSPSREPSAGSSIRKRNHKKK